MPEKFPIKDLVLLAHGQVSISWERGEAGWVLTPTGSVGAPGSVDGQLKRDLCGHLKVSVRQES